MNFLKICFVAIICLSLWPQHVSSAAPDATGKALEIIYSDWAIKSKPSIVEKSFDKVDIARFIELLVDANNVGKAHKNNDVFEVLIRDLDSSDVEDFHRELQDEGIVVTRVGDFKWIDLDSDGVYDLLASVDYSGRVFYNTLYIVKQNNGIFTYQEIPVWNVERMNGVIDDFKSGWRGSLTICFKGCKLIVKDFDNDGYQELIFPQLLTDYRGARPMAFWTAIYKWNGKEFQDESRQFQDFYKSILLPKIETRIQEIKKDKEKFQYAKSTQKDRLAKEDIIYDEELDEALSSEYLVMDKIIRLIGQDPKAGLERAKKWMYSPNDNLRKNAIVVFGEIKDEESVKYLEKLSLDPNTIVADKAKYVLDKIKKKQ